MPPQSWIVCYTLRHAYTNSALEMAFGTFALDLFMLRLSVISGGLPGQLVSLRSCHSGPRHHRCPWNHRKRTTENLQNSLLLSGKGNNIRIARYKRPHYLRIFKTRELAHTEEKLLVHLVNRHVFGEAIDSRQQHFLDNSSDHASISGPYLSNISAISEGHLDTHYICVRYT
jgi:hypothetical protein